MESCAARRETRSSETRTALRDMSVPSGRSPGAPEDPPVKQHVGDEDEGAEHDLAARGQSLGVDETRDVVVDEAPRIAGVAGPGAEGVFQRCQRARPGEELDPDAPRH